MMEAGTVHAGGRAHRPRPPVRCRRTVLAALVGLASLVPVTGGRPARAGTGCQVAPTVLSRTAEGLPKESGEASGFAASQRYPGALWMIRDSGHPPSSTPCASTPTAWPPAG